MEIREWSRLPEGNKTVARCMEFFTEAFENCMEETLQGALTANTAQKPTPATVLGKWDYCHTHGLCQHSSADCNAPAANHKAEATLDRPMGGSSQIQFPGYRRPSRRPHKQHGMTTGEGGTTVTTAQATQVSSITEE